MEQRGDRVAPLRLVAIQLGSGTDPAANRERLERAVRDGVASARANGIDPQLVVLPEASQCDFGDAGLDLRKVAEPLDGPFVTLLTDLASSHEVTLVAGMFEQAPEGPGARPFNTLVVVSPQGLGDTYRKVHLYDAFGYAESERMCAGEARACVPQVAGVAVGLMTCYDLRFPEQARAVVDAGAELVVVPAAWLAGEHKLAHWQTLLRARAIENTVSVLGVAKPGPRYCGSTMLVDPMGAVRAELGTEEAGHLAASVERSWVQQARALNPSLANRRWQVLPGPTPAPPRAAP